ncbi:DUF805 domain-containing protein [Staphylococcus edaphicus]|uniref:DUF805 domain-containing protein n=1 Tax=Staphylococcus edaphicus TaxID=1955013 RepID=A0A2C6WS63_9STAP|nr:DUF805 domain-containing protein [Staphylococcus edaphicus]PHK50307.1 DUF805 domain-containing protein [Staphylococcus edaphicus]UQW82099.1 DUF805 domain-containing protein [Staphylococcus edaphicus]
MERSIGFGQALKLFWKNYVNFKGRSRRREYWYMALWHLIFLLPSLILAVAGLITLGTGAASYSDAAMGTGIIVMFLGWIYSIIYGLATIVPNWAILIRRFHDTGRTMLIPLINLGVIVVSYPILIAISVRDPDYTNPINIVLVVIIYLAYLAINIYMIVICCLDSERKTNKYGSSHKYGNHIQTSDNRLNSTSYNDASKHEETSENVIQTNNNENHNDEAHHRSVDDKKAPNNDNLKS